MAISKSLLLKGLLGLGVCGGGAGLVALRVLNKETEPKTDSGWIESVGLSCGNEDIGAGGTDCTITSKKLNVKLDDSKKSEGLSQDSTQSSSGKIKVYKVADGSGYEKNLKFVIEGGDITLTGGTPSNAVTKLEEFETYEIKEDTGKWYLSRKTDKKEGIKKALGLDGASCDLPADSTNSKDCTGLDANKLKNINFEGKKNDGNITLSDTSKTATLKITKLSTADANFPLDYKFELTSESEITIPGNNSKNINIKKNTNTEFKIKKGSDKKSLTLEKAWDAKSLGEKVGLTCTDSNGCTLNNTGKINVKQENNKSEINAPTSSDSSSGKIKVYKDQEGYNQGFKFVIEEGDITLSSSGTITKLEEFETYEIKEDTGKWYLSRKTDKKEGIKKALGLDGAGCDLPTDSTNSKDCTNLDATKLKAIKFEGKKDGNVTFDNNGTNKKLKITKETDTSSYPLGYKFVFEVDKDITIPKEGNNQNITIKANTNTEFKIKKGSDKKSLTLEKAWDAKSLGEKVGLTCEANSSNKECTFTKAKVNVYDSESSKVENASVKDNTKNDKKMKYEEDQEGHNQGFKFFVESTGSDLELEVTGVSSGSTNTKITKQDGSTSKPTYEIKKHTDGKWYLFKKS